MKRKFNFSIKLYDFSNNELVTLFDINPLFESKKIICFSNKSYSKIYICLDYIKHDNHCQISKFYLLNKIKIDKKLDITKVFLLISNLNSNIEIENFNYQDFKFYLDNYSKFLSKLNKIKNAK